MNKLFSINVHGHVLLECCSYHNFLNRIRPGLVGGYVSVLPDDLPRKILMTTFVFSSFTGPSKRRMSQMTLLECDDSFLEEKSAPLI